ncbi:6-phosphogluconolactonase (cycloisomerase 2 family) [Microbacterium resistens]|uniref:6-phosphogluconolactonase (Cycloisomerase 2 family) n=1 Tax=Microbacterium resistens TaxID=156977 RepID=A0ABU1SBG4_9MICO|nr:beta-propeller fold lactonase family protein [Microbacterium resistens]MDR6866953.1 6-phosphogluconolactonase (cycloisomerase 2 family) [Microbacterium resistens]
MTRFWVGGYGPDMGGAATGIGLLAGDEGREPTTLAYRGAVVPAASPSWLAAHPRLDVVYAALEGAGAVAAFTRSGETSLTPLGRPVDAGESVCHLAVAPDGGSLIASCYGDGRVVRFGLGPDGSLLQAVADDAAELRAALLGEELPESGAAADPLAASDPYASDPDRLDPNGSPRVSHAHASAFLPDGRIATTDLGFDLVRFWRQGPSGLILDHEVVLPRGTGPRHMVVHPSGHLHVVTEYSCEVFTLAAGPDGRWAVVAATMTAPIAQIGSDFPAELARSRDGATLYTALRGSNTIAALRVRGAGEIVEPLALADSGVDWPRHHLVHDGLLLVAGQRSDDIVVLDLDDRTGAPGRLRHRTPAPAPTVFLPVR